MVILIYFLPALLILGIITSYEDIKQGKIKNKWIVAALIYSFLAYTFLIISSIYSEERINLVYVVQLFTNIILALTIGFGVWLAHIWTAGDAKLFLAYSALIPLSNYKIGYVDYFPSAVLLINTFIPVFIYLFFILMMRTTINQKTKSLEKVLKPKNMAISFVSLFAIFWIIKLLFSSISMQINYFFNIIISIAIFNVFHRLFKKKVIMIAICISILRLAIDKSVYSLEFVKHITLLFLFWIVFRSFIKELGKVAFSEKVHIMDLKAAMIPVEVVFEQKDRYIKSDKISPSSMNKALFDMRAEGLTKNEIKKLKSSYKSKNISFNSLRIKQTWPFAPFMFLGVLLTILTKGNFLTYLVVRFL